MGCSTSSQTSAVDTTRPSAKPEESNGASTTGAANENGKVAEDSETIPDQTPPQGADAKPAEEPAATAASADNTATAPPAGEEPKAAPADKPPAEESPPAADSGAETAPSSTEPEAAAPEQEKAEATAADSEPKTEETTPPSE